MTETEIFETLRRFYAFLLREYDTMPLCEALPLAIDRFQNTQAERLVSGLHAGLNTKVCVAKAVLERL